MVESYTKWMLNIESRFSILTALNLTAETHFQFQWNSSRIGFPVASLPVNQENA